MFKTLKNLFKRKNPSPQYLPYKNEKINFIYQLLFCEEPQIYRQTDPEKSPEPWEGILLKEKPDVEEVKSLVTDETQDSRIRALASRWLQKNNQALTKRELLGIIIEQAFAQGGMDTLAVYADGRVRYINFTESVGLFEQEPSDVVLKSKEVLATAAKALDMLSQNHWIRSTTIPVAKPGVTRLSFLATDWFYAYEGQTVNMEFEKQFSGPILQKSAELLELLVKAVEKKSN